MHATTRQTRFRGALAGVLGALALVGVGAPAAAAAIAEDDRQLIVRFRAAADAGERADARREADAKVESTLPVRGMQLLEVDRPAEVREAVESLEDDPLVLYAEPNVERRAAVLPSDTRFGELWGLHNTGQTVSGSAGDADADIDAPEAWDLTIGSSNVTVAVIDTGVDTAHPDLAPNVAVNAGESGGGREANGLDDDGNGFVDDVSGWDFVKDDKTPEDDDGHGTHVAGTLGARGNDAAGVAGVSWSSKLLPLKVLGPQGGSVADLIEAYDYAGDRGVRILNLSLAGGFSQAERDKVQSMPNTLFVAAAGNDGVDNDDPDVASYPCALPSANVLCVGASTNKDGHAGFSNYGDSTVDLSAPGSRILSTWNGSADPASCEDADWCFLSGTSMATPHASGTAALALATFPDASTATLKRRLMDGADRKSTLTGRSVTGARLNALGALTVQIPPPPPPPQPQGTTEPQPQEPTPQPTGETSDTATPVLALGFARTHRRSSVLARGLAVSVKSSEGSTGTVELTVGPTTAARLGLGRRRATIGRAAVTLVAGQPRRVVVRLTHRAARGLRRVRAIRPTLRVTVFDGAGNRRALARALYIRT